MPKEMSNTLYHYCSLETFLSIVKNKSIWLSDISKSNDRMELSWLKNRYESFLLEKWVGYVKSKTEINDLLSVDFEAFDQTRLFSKCLLKSNVTTCFAFCLSECCDDLGQWRGYADDGRGISIGFNPELFCKLGYTYIAAADDFNFNFCKVEYGDSSAKRLFSKFDEAIDLRPEMSSQEVLSKLASACVLTMEKAPTIKNNGFEQENEWRLIYNISNNDIKNGIKPSLPACLSDYAEKVRIKELSYTVKKDDLVGHIEMEFSCMQDMISEIVIGPKCLVTEDDILMLLVSEGVISSEKKCKIKIRKSTSSYI